MVSFKLRKVFYSAAEGSQQILLEKKKEIEKMEELEKQIILAKKILNSIDDTKVNDTASLIRIEGKLRKLENKIKAQKYKVTAN